jgi:hypothetical protein
VYYRTRIEDFVIRIKNIINTQNKQVTFATNLEPISEEVSNDTDAIEAGAVDGGYPKENLTCDGTYVCINF